MISKTLPRQPGVYLFKDKKDSIIYVGKAKSLKNRVASYFNKSQKTPKTEVLVRNINDVDYIIVDNEVEALLLENKLIKKHKPKYNINLKDAKTYAYIKITDEKFPRLLSTRKVTKKGAYFGPFTDGSARYHLVHLAQRLFKLRTCKTLPKRACLNYHIGLCTAPCIQNVTQGEYLEQVERATQFLKGDARSTVNNLKKEMVELAKKQMYEQALEKRNQIESISVLKQKQKVDLVKRYDQDVLALQTNHKATIAHFSIRKGVIQGKKEFTFEVQDDLFESFLKAYYATHYVPNEIIVSEKFWASEHEKSVIEAYLARIKGAMVKITYPKIGEKKALVDLALKNAMLDVEDTTLRQLQEQLNLPTLPRIIECFDISNLGDQDVVAGMTRFVNGKPDKNGYRKFEIKSHHRQDDFASMQEAVYRRYKRLQQEQKDFPDLILVDGGPGQLSAALKSLKRIGAKIPAIALAKKEEELYLPYTSKPKCFDKSSRPMLLLRGIRDQTHRFAITYNRKKRQMRMRD